MHQRRRIVLLFGIGIVLPSLLLGYLAFRGIQNDRALVEKERLEETRRAADRIVRVVDDTIRAVEEALAKALADHPGTSPQSFRAALERLAAGNPLVEQVFDLRGFQDIHFPIARLLYIRDGYRESGASGPVDPGRSSELRVAERLEFREKNFPGALAAYRQVLGRANDPRFAGTILNAIARVQRKSGHLQEAIATYERIVREHGDVVIPGGLALGPSAGLEICRLTRELGDLAKALRAALGLYRSLVLRDWTLERTEYEFFARRAKSLIEELISGQASGPVISSSRQEFQNLEARETEQRRKTERAIVFQERAAQALQAKAKTTAGPDAPGPHFTRQALDIGELSYLVSLERPAARADTAPERSWGIVIDAERLRTDVLWPALRDHLPSGETSWAVRGRDGGVIRSSENPGSGPAAFRTNFIADFPDWTLEFHQPPPRLIKTFLLSRRGLYSFVFLLIAGILVFGLVLTIRAVSHELELARMKSDFVSTISHEFKSPLTSIRQLAEMLQSGRVPSEERRQKYYDVLLEQSERLSLLIDNILSLAKIEEGRRELVFAATDLGALLQGVVASIQDRVRFEGFRIELTIENPVPPVPADRGAMIQAVTNLIDNAIKYSGESREVSVGLRAEGREAVVRVRDRGIGIRKEEIAKVFERFYRGGDELTRTVKGSGLGLTLVKDIVEAHGGKVQVESEPGRGSTFAVRLPIGPGEGG